MSHVLFQKWISAIEKHEPSPAYVLFGENNYFKTKLIESLKHHMIHPHESTNLNSFSCSSSSGLDSLIHLLNTTPFFHNRQLIITRDFFKSYAKSKAIPALVHYLKNPAPFSILVILENEIDKRTSLYKTLSECATVCECSHLNDSESRTLITDMLKSQQKTIATDASDFIITCTNSNLSDIESQLNRIVTFLGNSVSHITLEHIQQLVDDSRVHTMFEFLDYFFEKRADQAIFAYHSLITDSKVSPLAIVSMLFRQLGQFHQAFIFRSLNPNRKPYDILKEIGVPPFVHQKFLSQLKKTSINQIIKSKQDITELDVRLKSHPVDGDTLIEHYILAYCANL